MGNTSTKFHRLKLKMPLLFLTVFAACFAVAETPVITAWDLGREEPHFYLQRYDAYKQKSSYETMPDGKKALKLDLTQSLKYNYEGYFRSYRYLPDFSRATLTVPYYVPEKGGVLNFSVLLCDRYNEQFPLQVTIDRNASGWQTAKFELDAAAFQKKALKTGIRSIKQNDSGGKDNFYDHPMRVIGISGNCDLNAKENNWIAFGAITLQVQESRCAIRPKLMTGTDFHVLKKGDESKLAFSLFNPEAKEYSGSLSYVLSDPYGKTLRKATEPVAIAGGAAQTIRLDAPRKYGVYDLTVTSESEGKEPLSLKQSFCYMDPTGATPGKKAEGFLFGIDTHFPSWRIDAETEAEAVALCGAKIVRENTDWNNSQPEKEFPVSYAYISDPFEPFEKLGLEFQPTLLYTPKWAVSQTTKPIWPEMSKRPYLSCPDFKLWRAYVREYFLHTKGRMRYYEVWNEADIAFANFPWVEYIELQRIAYEELKKINPDAFLLTNGYACGPGGGRTDRNHLQKTLRDAGSYDILAFHGHCTYPVYKPQIKDLVDAIGKIAPAKQWYCNETAVTSSEVSKLQQGVTLFQKLIFSWANGAMGYTWYDFRDDGYDPEFSEHNYGMVTRDFYPKPVYNVFNTLTKHLTQAEYLKELSYVGIIEGYLFRGNDGNLYYAFWRDLESKNSKPVRLDKVRGKAMLIDMFGNEKALPVTAGYVTLSPQEMPCFLKICGKNPPIPQLKRLQN